MSKSSFILLSILALSQICDAYKILVSFPLPGRSHSILGYGVVKHLLDAGHEVTFITSIIDKTTNPKLHLIDVSGNFGHLEKETFNIKKIMDKESAIRDHDYIMNMTNVMQVLTFEDENFQKLVNDLDQQFDLVIVEWLFTELGAGLAAVFNAPFIWLSSLEPHWVILRLVDESLNPAYSGDALAGNIPPFTFQRRLQELWIQMKTLYFIHMHNDDAQSKLYDQHVAPLVVKRGRTPPLFKELQYNASLILGNSHVSLGVATRLPQVYKPIGGYHIDDIIEPLPQDLKEIMDNAKHGVIYFSMGSNLRSQDFPDELKRSLLQMFSELKQTVFWKFEEEFPNLPKNIHVLKWAPQQSILAHPNCVLFITHGGLLSTTETIHYGVPIIGIPVYADQFINVHRAVGKGFAKKVDLSCTMAADLKETIVEMTSDPKYKQKAKELSFIYHDRPVKPGVELVHWAEHVIKTRGAPHLRSPALMVPWYHKTYLDFVIVVLVALSVVIYVFKKLYSSVPIKMIGDKKYK